MQFVWAFLIGGLICVIGQILIDKTNLFLRNLDSIEEIGVDLTPQKERYPVFELKKILNNNSF